MFGNDMKRRQVEPAVSYSPSTSKPHFVAGAVGRTLCGRFGLTTLGRLWSFFFVTSFYDLRLLRCNVRLICLAGSVTASSRGFVFAVVWNGTACSFISRLFSRLLRSIERLIGILTTHCVLTP